MFGILEAIVMRVFWARRGVILHVGWICGVARRLSEMGIRTGVAFGFFLL